MRYSRADYPRYGLYRSRQGVVLGVCRGVAEYLCISVAGTRLITLLLMVFSGIFPVLIVYFIAALLMKPEPIIRFVNEGGTDSCDSYSYSRQATIGRMRRVYDDLNSRLHRIESIVTSREYDWESRMNQ